MFYLNGKVLEYDVPFEYAGNQYPASWLRLSTAADRAAIGITEMQDVAVPNSKFYFIHQMSDGSYNKIPRDLVQSKQVLIQELNREVSRLLAPSDYRVIKAVETGEAMPESWKTWRSTIRSQAAAIKSAIDAADTVEQLENVRTAPWAASPDQ